MKKVTIGKSDLSVRPFALGGNVFGWTADQKTSFDILDTYTAQGFELIDTADMYSNWVPGNKGGESETIIGNWLKKSGKRNDVVLATKVGAKFSETQSGLKKEYILKQVETSLKRLQTDHIDLYYSHYDDPNTPIEETLEAYALLVQQGKVRYIGASNMSAERLRLSIETSNKNNYPAYICMQPQYNLYDREPYESEYSDLLLERNVGSLPYYSLASGFLSGKYSTLEDITKAARQDALKSYMNEKGQRILTALQNVAHEHDATPAQIALAWLLANPSITAPIASVSKVDQLDILACVDIQLSPNAMSILDKASK